VNGGFRYGFGTKAWSGHRRGLKGTGWEQVDTIQ
jgi:hypothetical protein